MRKTGFSSLTVALLAGAMLLPSLSVAPSLGAQVLGNGPALDCSSFPAAWSRARDKGPALRSQTLKSAMDALDAGNQQLGPCMAADFKKHYLLIAAQSSAADGFAKVINEIRQNLNTVRSLPAAQQCPAAKLFVEGWNQFRRDRDDVPEFIHGAMSREHTKLCAAA